MKSSPFGRSIAEQLLEQYQATLLGIAHVFLYPQNTAMGYAQICATDNRKDLWHFFLSLTHKVPLHRSQPFSGALWRKPVRCSSKEEALRSIDKRVTELIEEASNPVHAAREALWALAQNKHVPEVWETLDGTLFQRATTRAITELSLEECETLLPFVEVLYDKQA